MTQILVTGSQWAHLGHRSVEAVLDELLESAKRDVIMTVYLATATNELLRQVRRLLERGVEVRLIFNDWPNVKPKLKQSLPSLATRYSHLYLYSFDTRRVRSVLHAKAVAVDGSRAIVGSANLSRAALLWNYEMGVLLEGPAAQSVSRVLYGLISTSTVSAIS